MKFLIVFALAFATVLAKDLYFRSIEAPVLENEGRISNGKDAQPGQFSYQVGLDFAKFLYTQWCGGSLIEVNWVLTAGHCADGASWAMVYLGSTERLKAEITYNVSKSDMFIHPGWYTKNRKSDISLIRIPTTDESGTIGIVRLPRDNDLKYYADIVVISGWGYTNDYKKKLSPILKYAILEVSPGSICKAAYEDLFSDDSYICAATPDGVSPCGADSGGPLVLHGKNLQIGILSLGSKYGCTKGKPITFTRISNFLPWIKLYIDH